MAAEGGLCRPRVFCPGSFLCPRQEVRALPALTTARVLTVDDDPIVRADLRLILEEAGFDVCTDARDGVEAVELARTQRPDLILMDLSLPNVDGVEATPRILRARRAHIVALPTHLSEGLIHTTIES